MGSDVLAGRYQLLRTIGKGSTGNVWEAVDGLLHRSVAIKLIELADAKDPATAERFRREGVAIANINHPSIVRIYDAGTDDTRGWLVMDLLAGPNLNTLVKERGTLPFGVGLRLLANVAAGLQSAHDSGITHRDVKPANIVLDAPADSEGNVPDLMEHPELAHPVLVDFGIARLIDQTGLHLTRPATAIGTAAYMSPEQARAKAAGPPSDVYSLGCVVYHTFAGRPPFIAKSSVAIAHAQAFDEPVALSSLNPDTPPALNDLVMRMLTKDLTERPSARQVSEQMLAIASNPEISPLRAPTTLTGSHLDVDPTTMPQPALPMTREPNAPLSHRVGRWMLAILFAALVGALFYSWFGPARPQPTPTVTLTNTVTRTHSTSITTTTSPTPEPTTEAPPPPPVYTEPIDWGNDVDDLPEPETITITEEPPDEYPDDPPTSIDVPTQTATADDPPPIEDPDDPTPP